jgi:hypothetical protein
MFRCHSRGDASAMTALRLPAITLLLQRRLALSSPRLTTLGVNRTSETLH